MNFSAIEALALEYLDDPNGRRFKDDSLKRLINAGMDDVKRVIEDCADTFFVTQTTTDGNLSGASPANAPPYRNITVTANDDTVYFELPDDFSRLILVEDVSKNPPVPATPVHFQDRHPTIDTRMLPAGLVYPFEYVIQGTQIGFVSPGGGNEIRLTYIKNLPRYTAGSDTPEIPADWHDLIAINAAKRGYAIEQREFSPDLEILRQEQNQQLRWSMENRDISHQRFPNIID